MQNPTKIPYRNISNSQFVYFFGTKDENGQTRGVVFVQHDRIVETDPAGVAATKGTHFSGYVRELAGDFTVGKQYATAQFSTAAERDADQAKRGLAIAKRYITAAEYAKAVADNAATMARLQAERDNRHRAVAARILTERAA